MPSVKFTSALSRFFPELQPGQIQGDTVRSLIDALEQEYPGLQSYLLDDQGRLRQHVNIFIGNEMVKDRENLSDSLHEGDEVYIMQALSGG